MKKITLLLVVVASVFVANGQTTRVGIKSGANLSNVVGSDVEGTSMKIGYHGGAYVSIGITENFAIQPEVIYSTKGYSVDFFGLDFPVNISYIEIPVSAQFWVNESFNVSFGPYAAFKIGTTIDGVDTGNLYEPIDIGLNLGLGYELESGLNFYGRGGYGLTSIEPDFSANNLNFQLGVGYSFIK